MGIVVTVFMRLRLLFLLPVGAAWLERRAPGRGIERAIVYGLLVAGLWNSLWRRLRRLGDFWGLAALFSGFTWWQACRCSLARATLRAHLATNRGGARLMHTAPAPECSSVSCFTR